MLMSVYLVDMTVNNSVKIPPDHMSARVKMASLSPVMRGLVTVGNEYP